MNILKLTATAALSLALVSAAMAETFTKGVVEKIDSKGKRLTIAHEELKDLDKPAMTMVFRVLDDTMLENLSEGAQIEFVAERIDGKLTITRLK